MTVFYGIPVPDPIQVDQWTGDNQSELESWLGTDITVNNDQSITFVIPGQAHGGLGSNPATATVPLNGYVIFPGWTVSATDPTAPGGPLQPFTPGQTYTLSS